MRVLMLGWEFPPFISGGLGTACYGLTKALSYAGTDVTFVLPRPVAQPFGASVRTVGPTAGSTHVEQQTEHRLEEFEHVSFRMVDADATYGPYGEKGAPLVPPRVEEVRTTATRAVPVTTTRAVETPGTPGYRAVDPPPVDVFGEVQRYAELAAKLAKNEPFDVVHAHDWMTFPAGLAVAAESGKPLVVHVHSTEFDRSGDKPDTRILDIERRGMTAALRVLAVSHRTRDLIVNRYGVDPNRVEVVHNAVDASPNGARSYTIKPDEPVVLFLGRITGQKGPDYFVNAARKVLSVVPDARFVMAGSGDLAQRTVDLADELGIADRVLFTGFLRGKDVEAMFKVASVYVMPSVSEPFGIASLEAMSHDVPAIISKQSGAAEVVQNALKVDFWDVDDMADKIVAVLKRPPLAKTLVERAAVEVRKLTWADSAAACQRVYQEVAGATV